ncbi:unnamed protein product [Candidula unifasciata]|uniref:UBC core domain-containing protein n=1 Tax=Candidula unifasciata TaxID=100452 RepID=A0A8S3Z8C1_9EUPU|nr:unnamed protein product [Candidula unifasciata]
MAESAVESVKLAANNVTKRLEKELRTLMMSGISAFPEGDNMFKWIETIEGASGTVYENLAYKLSLNFLATYPIEAVKVKFETPCYHPNVDSQGNICVDILKENLLGEPNIDSPLNAQAADLWNDQTLYKKVLLEKYNKEVRKSNDSTQQLHKLS